MSKLNSTYCLLCIIMIFVCKSGASPLNSTELGKARNSHRAVIFTLDLSSLFDNMTDDIQNVLLTMGLDSKQIDDLSFYLSDIVGFPFGKIILSKGVIQELYKVKRAGSLTVTYSKKILNLDFNLGWDIWNAYFLYAHELIFTTKGFLDMVIYKPKLNFLVEVNFPKHEARMKKIAFTNVGAIHSYVKGNVADFVTNMAIDVMQVACRDQMLATIEDSMLEIVNQELGHIFPSFKIKKYLR